MGKVVEEKGFEIWIYAGDHTPPHVHVYKNGQAVRIKLDDIEIYGNATMNTRNIKRALSLVNKYNDFLKDKWEQLNG